VLLCALGALHSARLISGPPYEPLSHYTYVLLVIVSFQVADFGLARYVIDDQYTSNGGAKFPIKWSPPEVLNYTRFSSKSDVWAFGVLVWEVFTCGDMPYGRAKNPEVVERVQRGQILQRPNSCPYEVYEVSG
jgi:serine/threonine protein kinase